MLSKNELKRYSGLLAKKNREIEKKFIVEGKRLLTEGLHSEYSCELVCVSHQFNETNADIIKFVKQKNTRLEILTVKDLQKLCDTKSPQGVVAIFKTPDEPMDSFKESGADIIVALDEINDPGNLGTIIRTCDWFGIGHIILSNSCVELYNPKVIRSTMGSIFRLKTIRNIGLSDHLKTYKPTYKVLASDLEGTDVRKYKLRDKSIIIFSNEAHGLSETLVSQVDERVTIVGKGKAESLNVASAAAIILSNLVAD